MKIFKTKIFFESSSGSWQAGQEPNDYVKEILDRHQIQVMHKARKITVSDFETYDFIVGMDLYNIYELGRYADALKSKAKIHLLGEFNPNTSDNIIADPYFDNKKEDFEKCFEQISTSCSEFLKRLLSRNNGQEY